MENNLPKVLVVSINAWRENSGINTLMNIFNGWQPKNLAQIYTKNDLPNTLICHRFFQIAENKVLKSVFNRKIKTGIEYTLKEVKNDDAKTIQKTNKHGAFLSFLREAVWKFGKWKTKELDDFINSFNADILFFPIYPNAFMGRLQRYILKRTKKPVVCYMSDDNYSYKAVGINIFSRIIRFFNRRHVKHILKNCKQLFVISPKQKQECDRLFNLDSKVLTKGLDYTNKEFTKTEVNSPIKMVYTGKTIIGRWNSLALISKALESVNKEKFNITLDIYTQDSLTKKQLNALNRNGAKVVGGLTLDQVKEVQKSADVLVFVESLKRKYRYTARLSFSTKLTDYFLAGKCIFAIGDKDVAPIDYLKTNQAGIIATNFNEVISGLNKLVEDKNLVNYYAEKAFNLGKENHEQTKLKTLFLKTMQEVCKGENRAR